MVVLIDCPLCGERFAEPEGEPDGPVETKCPGCGQTFTASPKRQLALPEAAESGSLEGVEALLETGADPNATDEKGETPLHRAARRGHPEVAEVLLETGTDLTATDINGKTPLHRAAGEDSPEVAKVLLEAETELTATDRWGRTSLHWAAWGGSPGVAKVLLEAGADPTATGRLGRTPLYTAAREGHPEVAEMLLEAGADPTAADESGKTPLHRAARENHPKVAAVLLAEGANPNVMCWGRTPLHEAAEEENLDVAKVLLEGGANPSVLDTREETQGVNSNADFLRNLAVQLYADFPLSVLEALLTFEVGEVRRATAARSDAPDAFLDLMVRAGSKPDLSGLSDETPESISKEERQRLREAGPYGKRLVAAHPDTPKEKLFGLAGSFPEAFLQNPVVELLAMEDPGWKERLSPRAWKKILVQEEVPEGWLRWGTGHDDPEVRKAVAANESTPAEVLEELSNDPDEDVRRAARGNWRGHR